MRTTPRPFHPSDGRDVTGVRSRSAVRVLLPAMLAGASATLAASAASAVPATADVSGACADETGVTVVVDATALDGPLEVGCATDPATGTEALAQAGFAETRDPSGYICAVAGLPDPCPTEFTGSYWSYWTAAPGGEWTAYAEGSDTAVPAAGTVEGWSYGDGSQPPGVAPAEVQPGTGAEPAAGQDESDDAEQVTAAGEGQAAASDDGGDGTSLAVGAAVGVAIVGALAATIVRLRRRAQDAAQGPAQGLAQD